MYETPAVPLADVEVALRIGAAARAGGQAERTPTVAQLLAAFGVDENGGPEALARVQQALVLALADVGSPPRSSMRRPTCASTMPAAQPAIRTAPGPLPGPRAPGA